MIDLPPVRGRVSRGRPMSELTWLRVGGPAEVLFQPADLDDLGAFLRALPADVPVFPMGVGSNLIVRDGGVRGVVIRLGRGFNDIAVAGARVTAGAGALDAHVARRAAEAGVDLTFLRTIPGAVGGAVRMNAGCYGSYVGGSPVRARCTAVTRRGRGGHACRSDDAELPGLSPQRPARGLGARHDATFEGAHGRSRPNCRRRWTDATWPGATPPADERDRSAGSTFRNPGGVFLAPGVTMTVHDAEGMVADRRRGSARGAQRGGADVAQAPEFPGQYRGRHCGRAGGAGRTGARACQGDLGASAGVGGSAPGRGRAANGGLRHCDPAFAKSLAQALFQTGKKSVRWKSSGGARAAAGKTAIKKAGEAET